LRGPDCAESVMTTSSRVPLERVSGAWLGRHPRR
jgi:hypothetical protein